MNTIPKNWQNKLQKRLDNNSFRELKVFHGLIDFYSNDYLGISKNESLSNTVNIALMGEKGQSNGSTGSRLLSGNHIWAQRCEYYLSSYYRSESTLLFNSGYDANLGIMACMADRSDTIIYDEFSHASLRDGIRLSVSRNFSFSHNNIEDLKKKIQNATGQIFIVTESVFSMDGDLAPLKEIVALAKEYNALVIVDEAHAVGIYGNIGSGLVNELGLTEDIFIRIVTFGKGAGIHGAAALCSHEARKFLINFCRPFIYSTALPPQDCIGIMTAHEIMKEMDHEREQLKDNISYFRNKVSQTNLQLIHGQGPVCAIVISGNQKVKDVSNHIIQQGIGVLPVLSPTVPENLERLRIIIHSYNTRDEMNRLIEILVHEVK